MIFDCAETVRMHYPIYAFQIFCTSFKDKRSGKWSPLEESGEIFIKRTYFEQHKLQCGLQVELEIALGKPEAHRRNRAIPGATLRKR
jgi:hypothetical protein